MQPRLTRSTNRSLAGVCAGIAEFVGWRPVSVRLLWVLGTVFSLGVGGVVLYLVMSFVMPPPDRRGKFNLDDFRVQ